MTSKITPPLTHQRVQGEIEGAGKGIGKHLVAAVLGFILTILGLGMGVTIVYLPVGVPIGVIGVLMVIWGLAGRATTNSDHMAGTKRQEPS